MEERNAERDLRAYRGCDEQAFEVYCKEEIQNLTKHGISQTLLKQLSKVIWQTQASEIANSGDDAIARLEPPNFRDPRPSCEEAQPKATAR